MSGFALKCVAMAAMLIDHIGASLARLMPEPLVLLCRITGRIAMPLFCFLLAEGLFHTKNVQKYAGRLLMFAFFSEIPFNLLFSGDRVPFDFSAQNVFFTLFLGLLGCLCFDRFLFLNRRVLALLAILSAAGAAFLIASDYNAFGVLFVFIFYRFRGQPQSRAWAFLAAVLLLAAWQVLRSLPPTPAAIQWALVGLFELFALLPLSLYNGQRGGRGGRGVQMGFYVFYPAHLLLLAVIRLAVAPA